MSAPADSLADRGLQLLQDLPEMRPVLIADPRAILDAVGARDADAGALAMERYLGRVRDALIPQRDA